jgi:CO/xanthine dehydrogenase FAD-binding subunit
MIPPSAPLPTYAPPGLATADLVRARTIAEACDRLAQAQAAGKEALLLAGGTDWIVDRHLVAVEKASRIDLVVDVTQVDELLEIAFRDVEGQRRLVLGGGVTYWALRRDARVAGTIPMLAQMARDVGAVQIQTRGTLAGNIATASPAADGVPALMALDGHVTLASVRGQRRVALEAFFTGYRRTVMTKDEVIASIDVRLPGDGARVTWRKVGTRLAQAISKVALAAVVEVAQGGYVHWARFGMASVGPVTSPLTAVRAALVGSRLVDVTPEILGAALEKDIKPIDDVRSTGEYRMHVAKALLVRAVQG